MARGRFRFAEQTNSLVVLDRAEIVSEIRHLLQAIRRRNRGNQLPGDCARRVRGGYCH